MNHWSNYITSEHIRPGFSGFNELCPGVPQMYDFSDNADEHFDFYTLGETSKGAQKSTIRD